MKNLTTLVDLLEKDTTSYTLVEGTKDKAPVVIEGHTKASREWRALVGKYDVDSTIQVTQKKTAIVDIDLSINKIKALAGLVTTITGLEEKMDGSTEKGKKAIKELFTNPQARIIVSRWNTHLDSLGNELLDED